MGTAQRWGPIDRNHGFMKSIIKNQVDRDNYDKEMKAAAAQQTSQGNHFNQKRYLPENNRPRKPDQKVYLPPWKKLDPPTPECSEDEYMPKTLFCLEFEDKDGKKYKQYVFEGGNAKRLAKTMGDNRNLSPGMVKALEQRLQMEIDKRTKQPEQPLQIEQTLQLTGLQMEFDQRTKHSD